MVLSLWLQGQEIQRKHLSDQVPAPQSNEPQLVGDGRPQSQVVHVRPCHRAFPEFYALFVGR